MLALRTRRSRWAVLLAALLSLSLVAAACGGGDEEGDGDGTTGDAADEPGTPVRGGTVAYGLEAENDEGWCLPEAQLAISGIQVARAIYDTLTVPNVDGDYVPYLAESLTPNDTFDSWEITLREGVTFHDGTDLTAEVVKNNLDAFRGQYEGRSPLLFVFVFANIDTVEVVDDLTLTVTTKEPWPALPAALFGSGRIGIVGTGPARQRRHLRPRPDRHRPVPAGRVEPERAFRRRAQRGLLADRRER